MFWHEPIHDESYMTDSRMPPPAVRHEHLSDPPVYVIMAEMAPGIFSAVREKTNHGDAVLGFLSPVDAEIEAKWRLRPGRRHIVMPASFVPPSCFQDEAGELLVLCLHLGWLARLADDWSRRNAAMVTGCADCAGRRTRTFRRRCGRIRISGPYARTRGTVRVA